MQTDKQGKLVPISPYYGFFKSLGIGFLIFFVFSIIQTLILFIYILATQTVQLENIEQILMSLALNGDAIAVAEIPAAIFGVWFVFYFSGKRKLIDAKSYLKMNPPDWWDSLKWLGVMVLVVIAMQIINTVFERETPDFMNQIYNGSSNHLLLGIAVVIAAPFFEEFLFRGFIFEGLLHSRIGLIGALIIPAATWAVIHVQYGLFEIATIFIIGIILAIAKYRTQSIYIPIFMHMFMNLTASLFMEFADSVQ